VPTHNIVFYDTSPVAKFSTSPGGFYTYSGPSTADGTATITDPGTGIDGETLEDDNGGGSSETATADVTIGGFTSTGSNVDAEVGWLVRDTDTNETFRIVSLDVEDGPAEGDYLLSERPLIVGRSYETLAYDVSPDASEGGPAFRYAEQSGFPSGAVCFTAGSAIKPLCAKAGNTDRAWSTTRGLYPPVI